MKNQFGTLNPKCGRREISNFEFRISNFVNSEIRNSKSEIRLAFTLIELMVVITIIAILATLTLQVVGGLVGQARETATKTTISKIQGLLNQRGQALQRLTMRKGFLTGSAEYQNDAGLAAGNANLQAVLATKDLQRKYFPQILLDVTNSGLYPQIFQNSLASNPEILFNFLTASNVVGDSPIGTDTFSAQETKDADGDGLPEFIDAWGNPIRFYRWPTRLFRSGGVNNSGQLQPITQTDVSYVQQLFTTLPVFTGNLMNDLARDPDDPLQSCTAVPGFESNYHTPATFHVFLVVSAGPDGVLGLYEPDDGTLNGRLGAVKDPTALNDDIISLNIRAGGK